MSTSPQDQPSPAPQASHSLPSYDPDTAATHEDEQSDDSPQSPSQPSQDPHPPFDPVFTLLTNTTTNATTHPRVHYIFSDDDPSLLPSAIADDPSRRALLIDLLPSQPSASASRTPAWRVSWAASLSPDFALTSSRISEHENGSSGVDVMLRLEGVEREPVELKRVAGGGGDGEGSDEEAGSRGIEKGDMEDKEALVEDFRRRMGVLQKVVDEAAKREAVVAPYREEERGDEQEEEAEDDDDDDNEEAVTSGPRGDEDARQG